MNPSTFGNRKQLRLWAARVLLVWLFGVATGVANACLVQVSSGLSPAAIEHAGKPEHAQHLDGAQASPNPHAQHDEEAGAGKANCQDFCEKAAVSASGLKSPFDSFDVGPAPVFASMAMPVPEPVLVLQPAARFDGRGAPPIRIAFLRLAL
jgi:hypothetical protein